MYSSNIGFRIAIIIVKIRNFYSYSMYLNDIEAVKKQFKRAHGYHLDIDHPKTFNEKMQWLKINDRTPNKTFYADKYAVRDYMMSKYGEDGLVPLVFHTNDWRLVIIDNMPDYPIIIKPNHASGWFHIIYNKNDADWHKIKTDCRFWLSQNYFPIGREWQYQDIEPCILVEKLLVPSSGGLPNNYRLHCLGGSVEIVSVNVHLDDPKNIVAKKFNKNWDVLDFKFGMEQKHKNEFNNIVFEKPKKFERMVNIAEDIAKEFDYVRVDFYEVDSKLYFGEITFHDSGGYDKLLPFTWDEHFGNLVHLTSNVH
jgi:hypothetical protein